MRQLTSKTHGITMNNDHHYVDSSPVVETDRCRSRHSVSFRLRLICFLCVSYAVAMTVFVPTLCVLLSHFEAEAEVTCFPFTCFLAVYLSINLFGNWILFRVTPLSRKRSIVSNPSKVCSVCDSDVDRETSHCPICNVCVYRRDHHCFFLGRCVGHYNLRNFIAFCAHACIGCLYATLLVGKYLRLEYRDLWSKDFLYYLMPYSFVGLCTNVVTTHHFLFVVVLNGVVTTFISTLGMVLVHFYLVLNDLTSYEMWRCADGTARQSRRGALRNFEVTFGSNWGLGFLWPRSSKNLNKHSVTTQGIQKCV